MVEPGDSKPCKAAMDSTKRFRENIPSVVDELAGTCGQEGFFDHVGAEPIPSREAVREIISRMFRVLYPGYFVSQCLDATNLRYYLGQEITEIFELLSDQITLAIRHECVRHGLPCSHCAERGQEEAVRFLGQLPQLRARLAKDIRAAYNGDPAAQGFDDIIFSYPGLFALTVYRMAHELYLSKVPLLPRIMTEYAHGRTGIDINPGARIGESFFMDHGTGIVIGETADIGDNVRIYQGVTLGALSLSLEEVQNLRSQKRHPTIEDDVIIYANATILGGDTVIGARSIIGGSVWLTHSIPPDTRVFLKPEQVFLNG